MIGLQLVTLVFVPLVNTLSLVVIALTVQVKKLLRVVVFQPQIGVLVVALLLINGVGQPLLEVLVPVVFLHK